LRRPHYAVNKMLWLSPEFKQFLGVSNRLFQTANHKILGVGGHKLATVPR